MIFRHPLMRGPSYEKTPSTELSLSTIVHYIWYIEMFWGFVSQYYEVQTDFQDRPTLYDRGPVPKSRPWHYNGSWESKFMVLAVLVRLYYIHVYYCIIILLYIPCVTLARSEPWPPFETLEHYKHLGTLLRSLNKGKRRGSTEGQT